MTPISLFGSARIRYMTRILYRRSIEPGIKYPRFPSEDEEIILCHSWLRLISFFKKQIVPFSKNTNSCCFTLIATYNTYYAFNPSIMVQYLWYRILFLISKCLCAITIRIWMKRLSFIVICNNSSISSYKIFF